MSDMEFKEVTVLDDAGKTVLHRENARCWVSPDQKYAVTEFSALRFAIGKVLKNTEKHCTMRLLDRYSCPFFDEDDCILVRSDVEWSCMKYGFFKIVSWNMEEFDTVAHRYYFDKSLYEREKHRLHPGE